MSNKPQHILIVRLSAMGDVAMSVPVIRALVQQYPTVKVTVLTRAFFKPFFKDISNVSIYVPELKGKHKGFLGIQRLSKELQALEIDAVADLHNVLRSNLLIRFLKLKGIPYEQIDKGRAQKKALVRAKNKVFKPLKSTHERYSDVFKSLGFPLDLAGLSLPKPLAVIEDQKKYFDSGKQLIGIAPFAAHKGKMFPLEKMEQVIEKLTAEEEYEILLFGGGKVEKVLLDKLASKYKRVHNIAGKYGFEDELKLISNLKVMLSMDSGNGHIAAMLGVKVITIWGVTHPYAGFVPFRQPNEHQILPDIKAFPLIPTSIYGKKYPDHYLKCFDTIAVEEIVEKVSRIMN